MTVIVWDGEILAVDSRRSLDGKTTSDEAWKLGITYPKGRVRGKKVLAVVSCGNVTTTDDIKDTIRKGKDIEEVFARKFKEGALDDYKPGSVLILTLKNSYVFKVRCDKEPVLIVQKKDELLTMGSGGKYARFMVQVFKVSPQYAVAATMLHKRCCGGPVRYYKRPANLLGTGLGSGKVASIKFADLEDLRQKVMDAVRKKCHRQREPE